MWLTFGNIYLPVRYRFREVIYSVFVDIMYVFLEISVFCKGWISKGFIVAFIYCLKVKRMVIFVFAFSHSMELKIHWLYLLQRSEIPTHIKQSNVLKITLNCIWWWEIFPSLFISIYLSIYLSLFISMYVCIYLSWSIHIYLSIYLSLH